jgi:hypothetical protein
MLYTLRERRLKTLFLMEGSVALFGLPYIALLPAMAEDVLQLGKAGLGAAMSMIGVGSVLALVSIAIWRRTSALPGLIRSSMIVFGCALLALGFARSAWTAFPLLAILGMAAVSQFNSTNTLFQLIAPVRLRGRVLAMHMWALAGLTPIGALFFGWLASQTSLSASTTAGGACILVCAIWGRTQKAVFAKQADKTAVS